MSSTDSPAAQVVSHTNKEAVPEDHEPIPGDKGKKQVPFEKQLQAENDRLNHELELRVPTLLFKNPTFHHGVNTTVRRAGKYSDGIVGYTLPVAHADDPDNFLLGAYINRVRDYESLAALPQYVYDDEHDGECQTHEGLLKAMRSAYGGEFSETEPVTVIWFTPTSVSEAESDAQRFNG